MIVRYLKVPRYQEVEKIDGGLFIRESYHPIGCVVTDVVDGEVKVGWSLCHPNDTYSKKAARDMAVRKLGIKHVHPRLARLAQSLVEKTERWVSQGKKV